MFGKRTLFAAAVFFVFFLTVYPQQAKAKTDYSQVYAHYMMGVIFDNLNQSQEALEEFKQVERLDSSIDAINFRIALDYIKLDKKPQAIEALNRALGNNPDNLQARTLLAFLYTAVGEQQLAEIQYELILKQASKESPQNLEVQQYLGQLYFQQRKFEKATECFDSILKIEPKNIEAKLYTGLIYDETGRRELAIKEFKSILEIEADNADALNALGYIYAEESINLDEAENLINRALEQYPENPAYIDSLGWVYFKKNQLEKAREKLEEAVALIEDMTVFDHLGDVYARLGEKDKAKEIWQKAIKIKSEDKNLIEKIENKIKELQ
ncbi:MAG: tetratricopeptide repeat protein [Candidatus Omnitrophota bacterium]